MTQYHTDYHLVKIQQSQVVTRVGSIEHQLNNHSLNLKSVTVIMAEITKLIQVLTVNHKEQMEEQAGCHKEQRIRKLGNIGSKRRNMQYKWQF